MRQLFDLDKKDYDPNAPRFVRPSVRGIIIHNGLVAMVHSLKYNYYKFPGGGIEGNESHLSTLLREVLEETGLHVIPSSAKEYGHVHRIHKNEYDDIFDQDNFYYFCDVESKRDMQDLDDYEANEGFTLEYVLPQTAIQTNLHADHGEKDTPFSRTMIAREARVLELLIEEQYL